MHKPPAISLAFPPPCMHWLGSGSVQWLAVPLSLQLSHIIASDYLKHFTVLPGTIGKTIAARGQNNSYSELSLRCRAACHCQNLITRRKHQQRPQSTLGVAFCDVLWLPGKLYVVEQTFLKYKNAEKLL